MVRPTALLAITIMAIIVMMVLPVPAALLDIGLAASFALAVLIFTVTLFSEDPLDFSAFPTVLLGALMLRLSLNVSSTKLILGEGHTGTAAAGNVIHGFADFIMGGSIALGLVVFGVLMIVNFMVITKGATRMAEVGARFALDGMPGRQLAIDSDLSSGAITHDEARNRREREHQETTFFGSLDGASKFVKGDAIAGLLITLLNLVIGLAMGIFAHDMPIDTAFNTYAILTVGDGLVTQIPAVIISIATALLLSQGGQTGTTESRLFTQLGHNAAALATVSGLMVAFALIPGLPFIPFVIAAAILGFLAYWRQKQQQNATPTETEASVPPQSTFGDLIDVEDIHIEFAPDLVPLVLDPATGMDLRVRNIRKHIAQNFGVILPEIRLTDEAALPPGQYAIRILGVIAAQANLQADKVLLLDDGKSPVPEGEAVLEPVYSAPARWVDQTEANNAPTDGPTPIAPAEVLATHLLEVLKSHLDRLLGLKSLQLLLDEMTLLTDSDRAAANKHLLDTLIPDKVPLDCLHAVLRLLLAEQVSIRNIPLILEAISEARRSTTDTATICELVRQKIGFQLIADLKRPDGSIPLLQLDPVWEERFTTYQIDSQNGVLDVALPPDVFQRLSETVATKLEEVNHRGTFPALVTTALRRRFLRTVLSANNIRIPILSFEEIGTDARPALAGLVPP